MCNASYLSRFSSAARVDVFQNVCTNTFLLIILRTIVVILNFTYFIRVPILWEIVAIKTANHCVAHSLHSAWAWANALHNAYQLVVITCQYSLCSPHSVSRCVCVSLLFYLHLHFCCFSILYHFSKCSRLSLFLFTFCLPFFIFIDVICIISFLVCHMYLYTEGYKDPVKFSLVIRWP